MGLTAVCNEGELIVSYNGKVLQKYFLEDWLEVKEAELLYSGADYLEFYVLRQSQVGAIYGPEHPPTSLLDQAALNRQAAQSKFEKTGKRSSFSDMVRDLTCKEFNIETEVDPHFIHAVRLGWTGFYNITFAQLQRDLIEAQRFLKKQQEYQLLETRCKDLKAANVPITNIVVLGNGSIEEYSSKYSQARTESRIEGIMQGPMGQLAAAMEISRLLGGTSRRPGLRPVKPLPCIFQDPMTSRFEQRFLQSLGHKVVDDPDAFALINANSLVIFIHNPCMEEFIAEGVWPAAILAWASWESPQSWLDYLLQADESDSQIASASNQGFAKLPLFLQAYQQLPFLETRVMTEDGLMCKWVSKYDLHLKKDSDGVDGFSFTV